MTNSAQYIEGHALLVAAATYHEVLPRLSKVVLEDARSVANVLIDPTLCAFDPAKVQTLLDDDATLSAIRDELARLARDCTPNDTVIIYFSGHGGLAPPAGDPKGADITYFVPIDTRRSAFADTAISEIELRLALERIKARRLIVLLDACHSGAAAKVISGQDEIPELKLGYAEKSLSALGAGAGRVVLASSRASETSLILSGARNSLFTEHLLAALKGQGQPVGSRVVRVFNLFDYISSHVKQDSAGAQTPIFKATELDENFAIALVAGGKTKSIELRNQVTDDKGWQSLEDLLVELYPLGPTDQMIWQRAGGDLATLSRSGSGRAEWFGALRILKNGGGGKHITVGSLADAAARDYPNNSTLRQLVG